MSAASDVSDAVFRRTAGLTSLLVETEHYEVYSIVKCEKLAVASAI